jgi:hypothetical protein
MRQGMAYFQAGGVQSWRKGSIQSADEWNYWRSNSGDINEEEKRDNTHDNT